MTRSKIDMHMHCSASDGTDLPEEILQAVRKAGIQTFAVTDHDTILGSLAVEKMITTDLTFFRGIEFSCQSDIRKCHILGYDFDPENQAFQAAIQEGKNLRNQKLQNRLTYLEDFHHVRISDQDRQKLMKEESSGKPHLARVLISMGLADTVTDAINKYLRNIPGEKGGKSRISAATAISAIQAAGGIPVWAHPLGGEGERHLTQEEFTAQLQNLLDLGIKGLECYYSRYNEEEVNYLLQQARNHHLLISGGSDYHGRNKNIPLGCLNAYEHEIKPQDLTLLNKLLNR